MTAPKDPDPSQQVREAVELLGGRVREATQSMRTFTDAFTKTVPRGPRRVLTREEVPAIAARFKQRFAEIAALHAFLHVLTWTKERSS